MSVLENGSALAAKPHVVTKLAGQTSLISWACESAPDLSNISMEDVRSYLFFLQAEHYSLICLDGAIVQMSFKIRRGEIVNHRLCYIPCPVRFDSAELQENGLYDVVERNVHSQDYELIRHRGAMRFDFDPDAAGQNHPSAHLTMNFDDVRIPVGRSFDAATFLTFVDDHFLANSRDCRQFDRAMSSDRTHDILSADDRCRPHFRWDAA